MLTPRVKSSPVRGTGQALLTLALFASAVGWTLAESPEELFDQGNQAYEQGRYEDAVDAYRALLRYRIEDPRVEYNLGNAEFRLGKLGRAILHYERARRLDPTDPDIRANLELARMNSFDRVEPAVEFALLRSLHAVQDRAGPERQAWLAVTLVWLIGALVAWCSARPGGWRAVHGWLLSALVVLTVVSALSWYSTFQRLIGVPRAVVLAEVAEVLAGPGDSNPTLFTVHEGLTLEVQAVREEWVQVSLPNNFNGWITRGAVEII